MKREIKFRYWKKDTATMESGNHTIYLINRNDETVIPLQYTGLKDKNGKEIYEGDILEYKENYEPYKCVIEWNKDLGSCGCCFSAFNAVGFVGRVLPGSKYKYSELADRYEMMEIIGNIYENPELLK